jgi:hypothetical protein
MNSDPAALLAAAFPRDAGKDILKKQDVSPTVVSASYLLLSEYKPTPDSNFKLFSRFNGTIFSENFGPKLVPLREQLPVQSIADYSAFLDTNLRNLSVWYSAAITAMDSDLGRVQRFVKLLRAMSVNLKDLLAKDASVVTVYTPYQINQRLNGLLADFFKMLKDVILVKWRAVKGINTFAKDLQALQKSIKGDLANGDFLLSDIDNATFTGYRTSIADFCFYIAFVEVTVDNLAAVRLLSEMVLLVDQLMAYRNASAQLPTTPWDIGQAASYVEGIFLELADIVGDVPAVNNLFDKAGERLATLGRAFRAIVQAFSQNTISQTMVQGFQDLFKDLHPKFEFLIRKMAATGLGKPANNLTLAFYQFLVAMRKLPFTGPNYVFDPAITNATFAVDEVLGAASHMIDDLQILGPEAQYSVPGMLAFMLNPSRKGRGLTRQGRQAELDKLPQVFRTHISEVNQLQPTDYDLMPRLTRMSREICLLGYAVDMFLPNNTLIEQYRECIVALNARVRQLMQVLCLPLDKGTPRAALGAAVIFVRMIIEHLTACTESKDKDVVADAKAKIATFEDMVEGYELLSIDYSELNLFRLAQKIDKDRGWLTTFQTQCKKFDHVARESYLRLICQYLLVSFQLLLTFIGRQAPGEKYTRQSVILDLAVTDSYLGLVSQQLGFNKWGLPAREAALVLEQVHHALAAVTYSSQISATPELIARLIQLRDQIEDLPPFMYRREPEARAVDVLNALSTVRWKLTHLEELFQYDERLLKLLTETVVVLTPLVADKSDPEHARRYAVVVAHLQVVLSWLADNSGRTGAEWGELVNRFMALSAELQAASLPKFTGEIYKSRQNLNELIALLGGQPLDLTASDPSVEFQGTYLERYIAPASANYLNYFKFFADMKPAVAARLPDCTGELRNCAEVLNDFIGRTKIPIRKIQEKLAIGIVWFLAVGKLIGYKQLGSFVDAAVAFQEAKPKEINRPCFALSAHFHQVLEEANAMVLDRDVVAQPLKAALEEQSNLLLADAVYYTRAFIRLIPKEHRVIFQVLQTPLRHCFHGKAPMNQIDKRYALAYLNGQIPDDATLRDLQRQYQGRRRGDADAEPDGLIGDGASAAVTRGVVEEPPPEPEPKPEPVPEPKIEPKPQPEPEPEPAEKKPKKGKHRYGKESESVPPPAAPAPEPKPDAPVPVIELPDAGEFLRTRAVEVNFETKEEISFQHPAIAVGDVGAQPAIDASLSGKAAWFVKAFTRHRFTISLYDFTFIKGDYSRSRIINEFNLPNFDRRSEVGQIDEYHVSGLVRAMAGFRRGPALSLRPLAGVFDTKFRPKLPSLKFAMEVPPSPKRIHRVFAELTGAGVNDTVAAIDTSAATKEELLEGLIPSVARLIEIISPQNLVVLLDFLAYFDGEEATKYLNAWVYLYFDPRSFGGNFFARYFGSVVTYIRSLSASPNEAALKALYKSLSWLIKIGEWIIAVRATDSKQRSGNSVKAVRDFTGAVGEAIGAISHYRSATPINQELVIFLQVSAPFCQPAAFFEILVNHLLILSSARPRQLGKEAPDGPAFGGLRLALAAIRAFATDPFFFGAAGDQIGRVAEAYGNLYGQAFATNDPHIIRKFVIVFSELFRLQLSFDDPTARLAQAFFPVLNVSVMARSSAVLIGNLDTIEHFAIPVLFILTGAGQTYWPAVYSSWTDEQQCQLIDLLKVVLNNLLTAKDLPPPDDPLPADIRDGKTELEWLDAVGKRANKELNYTLVDELTARVVAFVWDLLSAGEFRPPLMQATVGLFAALCSRHQKRENYALVLTLVSRFIDVHSKTLYRRHGEVLQALVGLGYSLTFRRLQMAKGAGCALLIHLLYRDFCTTRACLVSESFLNEQFMEAHWTPPAFKEDGLVGVLKILRQFLSVFARKDFAALGVAAVGRLEKLQEPCLVKKIEKVFDNTAKVNKLFVTAPYVQFAWLSTNVKVATRKKKWAAAFQFQWRLIVLIYDVVRLFGKESISEIQFDDVPPEERVRALPGVGTRQIPLLIDAPVFTAKTLRQAIDTGIKIAAEAGSRDKAAWLRLQQRK